MATHSSILPWRIPRTEEPGRLQSIGSQRVRHDCRDLACTQAQIFVAQGIFFAAFRTLSCPVQASLVMLHGLSNSGARASLPHGMWDLSSLARDLTRVPCIKG